MNTLEIYYERGIEKGRKEGKESFVRNLLAAGKFTVAEIANFADVERL